MSNDRAEASNPTFTYALEHQDSENGNDNPPAANGTDNMAIVPRTPMYIAQPRIPAGGNIISPGNGTTKATLVADMELMREANLGHMQLVAAQGEGFKIAAAQGVNYKMEERVRQRHELVQTDEGLHYRRVTHIEM